jgi:DNA-binding NtrC family response regulator
MQKLKNQRILVVEDDAQARKFMREFLLDEGCIVELAGDAKEAIEKFNKLKPRVVLLDIKLPGMNGIQLLKLIKSKKPDIQIIMTTGISTIEATQECLRAGAYTHIVKPIDFDSLSTIITEALHLQREDAEFAPKPQKKTTNPKTVKLDIDADIEHKLDALIRISIKKGSITYQEIIEEIEQIKNESK